jgi:hypothetical protein
MEFRIAVQNLWPGLGANAEEGVREASSILREEEKARTESPHAGVTRTRPRADPADAARVGSDPHCDRPGLCRPEPTQKLTWVDVGAGKVPGDRSVSHPPASNRKGGYTSVISPT